MSRPVKLSDVPLNVRRKIKRAAAKRGKELTPEQIIRRAKREKYAEEARQRAIRFRCMCAEANLPVPVQEFYFAADVGRRWRFDFAFVEERIALEVDGGLFVSGGHNRGAFIVKTHEKMNHAAANGWRVLYTTPKQHCTPETIALIQRAMRAEAAA